MTDPAWRASVEAAEQAKRDDGPDHAPFAQDVALTPAVAEVLAMLDEKRAEWAGLPVYRQILLARYATYSAAATEGAARLIDALEKMR